MDWNPTEMQQAIRQASEPLFAQGGDAWAALVEAGLTELTSPIDVAALLIAAGEAASAAPVFETLVLGAPARGRFADGDVLTAAFAEPGRPDPARSQVRADGGRLWGERIAVPALDRAVGVVVPTADGLWCVRTVDAQVEAGTGTDGARCDTLRLDGTPAEQIGDADALAAWRLSVHIGVSALLLGLSKGALALTASYTRERKQFGRPIGSFQAVTQRIADAWIDISAIDVALWRAAWLHQEGLPCTREALIARWLASEGAHRVTAAAQHLHGGFGFDKDYPLHRYFLAARRWEMTLGGPNTILAALGDQLAQPA